jgi:hypothetical protein
MEQQEWDRQVVVVVNSNCSHDARRRIGTSENVDRFEPARRPTGHGIRLRPLTVAVSGLRGDL